MCLKDFSLFPGCFWPLWPDPRGNRGFLRNPCMLPVVFATRQLPWQTVTVYISDFWVYSTCKSMYKKKALWQWILVKKKHTHNITHRTCSFCRLPPRGDVERLFVLPLHLLEMCGWGNCSLFTCVLWALPEPAGCKSEFQQSRGAGSSDCTQAIKGW